MPFLFLFSLILCMHRQHRSLWRTRKVKIPSTTHGDHSALVCEMHVRAPILSWFARSRCRGGFININRFVVERRGSFCNVLENAPRAPRRVRARVAMINGRKDGKGAASGRDFPLSRGSRLLARIPDAPARSLVSQSLHWRDAPVMSFYHRAISA